MKSQKTKRIVFAAVFAALIAICTRFTSIPIPGTSGFVHVGDAFVFLAAAMLPTPYAVASAAVGGALADVMYGSLIYVIPTFIIKALMALMFFGKGEKLLSLRTLLSSIVAIVVLCAGYYVAEVILFESFISPLSGLVWNAGQGIFSAILFYILAAALDSSRAKERLGL